MINYYIQKDGVLREKKRIIIRDGKLTKHP